MGGTWDATNVIDADGRGRDERRASTTTSTSARPARRSRRRRPGIVKPGVDARARRDRSASSCRSSTARRRGAGVAGATSTSVCARNVLAHRRPAASTSTLPTPRIPTCSSRCTARTRPTTRRSRSRPRRAFVRRRCSTRVVADAFARCGRPGRLEVVGRQPLVLLDGAHNVAGAEALRACARREEFATGAAHARRRAAAREGAGEMLAALGVEDCRRGGTPALLVCTARRAPRALDPMDRRERRDGPRLCPTAASRSSTPWPKRWRARCSRRPTVRSSSPARCTSWARPARVLVAGRLTAGPRAYRHAPRLVGRLSDSVASRG